MQPPSPFPYSGGSRMEQALVPALQGPNSNSMLGYVLGAQLQRQADQMGYDREMDQYNLTARDEAQRVQEATAADRQAQRNNAVLTSIINNPAGAAMVPADYNLTPEQRQFGTRALTAQTDLRAAQAAAAERRGTGTGSTRADPFTVREFGAALTDERTIATRLANLSNPATLARAVATATNGIYDLREKARITSEVRGEFERARQATQAELEAARQRRAGLRPGATPQQPATPTAATPAAPAGGQPTAQVDAGSPTPQARTTTAPTAAPQAVNPGSLPAEALAAARAAAGQIPGGQVRVSSQTGRPVVLDKDNNVVQRF